MWVVKAMTDKIGKLDTKALAAAIHGATISAKDYPGVLMDVRYDAKGDIDRESFFVKIDKGAPNVFYTFKPAWAAKWPGAGARPPVIAFCNDRLAPSLDSGGRGHLRAACRERRPMKTIRWGMIGCGEVAEQKSGPGALPGRELAARRRRRPQPGAREGFARRHGVGRWHDDAEAIIRRRDVDVVYVGDDDRVAQRSRPARRRGGQGGAGREADGDDPRRLPGDDRRLPAGEGPAVGRLLPPRAAALPQGPRTDRRRRDRRAADGGHAPLPAHPDARADARARSGAGGSTRSAPAAASSSRRSATRSTSSTYILGPIASVRCVRRQPGGRVSRRRTSWPDRFRFASGVHGSGAWCFSADCDDEGNEIVGSEGAHHLLDLPAAVAPGGTSAGADPPHPRRHGRGVPGRRPAVHAPAAGADDRRRDERRTGRCPSTARPRRARRA